ncbi:MAG: tRNA dihydrouridine synthase DusB [Pseudomonadota bacterium]
MRLDTPLMVGDVQIANRAWLAPMAGVTDGPFRGLAATGGAGLVVCEMTACSQLAASDGRTQGEWRRKLAPTPGVPFVVQLAGREPDWLARGARLAQDLGADIIDINMGCPAKIVTKGASGAALMRDLDLAERLIAATRAATTRPVTVKMRLGWDDATRNAPELAKRAQANGVAAVTVHGRTRAQFYKGTADWTAVRAVRAAITIPLIVNGDITGPVTARAALAASGADGVMVGRGSYGRPWLPGSIAHNRPARVATADDVIAHYDAMLTAYGVERGVRHARKHLGWYLLATGAPPASVKSWRAQVCQAECPKAVQRLMRVALDALAQEPVAPPVAA